MAVGGDLLDGQGDLLRSTCLGEDRTIPLMGGNAAAEIGQREGGFSVAPVGGANQLEQGFVLADREELTLAEHPTGRREVTREHADFSDIGLCHFAPLLSWGWGRCPEGRYKSS